MLVDTNDELVVVEMSFQNLESTLSEIAESGVVMPTFGVVEMRYHRCANSKLAEDVQPLEPVGVDSCLVDLIDGYGASAEREGSGRSEGDYSARGEFLNQHGTHGRVVPLA